MSTLLTQVAWQPIGEKGLEHLQLFKTTQGLQIAGRLVRQLDNLVFSAEYRITCSDDWTFQSVNLKVISSTIRILTLTIDKNGVWHDETGAERVDLFGCYEIDISATPFTNSLAIGRLNLNEGQSTDIQADYIRLPELTVEKVPQRYTARGKVDGKAIYTYEGLVRNFTADLVVDEYGLVLDYPETFMRTAKTH